MTLPFNNIVESQNIQKYIISNFEIILVYAFLIYFIYKIVRKDTVLGTNKRQILRKNLFIKQIVDFLFWLFSENSSVNRSFRVKNCDRFLLSMVSAIGKLTVKAIFLWHHYQILRHRVTLLELFALDFIYSLFKQIRLFLR